MHIATIDNYKPLTLKKNVKIQYLRAIASISVLLYHSAYYLGAIRGSNEVLVIFGGWFGAFGVNLFFAISGYLMASLAPGATASNFLVHRIVRIYPTYWAVFFVVVLFQRTFDIDFFAAALVPGGPHEYVLGIEWTLPFELCFYFIVFLAISLGGRNHLHLFAVGWMILIALSLLIAPQWQTYGRFAPLAFLPLSQKCVAFVAGLLIPYALRQNWIGPSALVVACLLLLASPFLPWGSWAFSFGCALLVAYAAIQSWEAAHAKSKTFGALGDWSFALYLCHVPIVIWVYRFLPANFTARTAWFAAIGASLLCTVVVGTIDVDLYGRMKRWCDQALPIVRHAINVAFVSAMLLGGGYWELRESSYNDALWRADSVGRQIETTGASTLAAFELSAANIGLSQSGLLIGSVDELGQGHVSGWAVDRSSGAEAAAVLLFINGRYAGAAIPRRRRRDVVAALQLAGAPLVGFAADVGSSDCQPGVSVMAIALSRRSEYTPMSVPYNAIHCRAS